MLDFHTHILPGIDDGAKDVSESMALLDALHKQGVDTVILTPHYYGRRRNVGQFLENRENAFQRLRAAYHGCIRLIKGCECNIHTCANIDFNDLKPLAIENTHYILTELSFEHEWSEKFWERIYNLLEMGLIPVIAHVELYPAVVKNPQFAYRLVQSGCLLQINCDSVLDRNKYKFIKVLIEHNQAYCLGSDTHNTDKRPPHYQGAVKLLEQDFGVEFCNSLQENMKKIISDEAVERKPTTPIKRTLFGGLK